MSHTESTISISGFRTRQTCGFFVPDFRHKCQLWRDERPQYNTLAGNKVRRLMPVVESRHPQSGGKLKHKEANHG